METVYHGSSTSGLKIIQPHESTHGTFVYGSTDIIVSTLFCKKCGDDVTYALLKASDGKYNIIELLPGVLEKMYNNTASIYTVEPDTFKSYNTNFNEIMSTTPVRTLSEKYIPNVMDELNRLNENGEIHLYRYPNKPNGFDPEEHLIKQRFGTYLKLHDSEKFRNGVYRLAGYHPELINRINEELIKHDVNIHQINSNNLLHYYEHQLKSYIHDNTHERYLDALFYMGLNTYPELEEEILSLINKYGYDYNPPIKENIKQV